MKGERLGHPEFGCEIHNLSFENMGTDIGDRVEEMIKESVDTWLPYLSIDKTVTEQIDNRLNVDIHFSLKNDLTSGEEVSLKFETGD